MGDVANNELGFCDKSRGENGLVIEVCHVEHCEECKTALGKLIVMVEEWPTVQARRKKPR